MKGKKLSMREIRKILEYRFDKHISAHRTALALKKSKGSIINTVKRFHVNGLSWPLPADMTDTQLESLLYSSSIKPLRARCPLPDCEYIQKELCRPHVTLQRLWEEYYESYPEGLSRSSFYRYVHKHQPVDISMKPHHKGGDKLFVDYSGDSIPYIDLSTGELIDTELFVCCWGASSYCYLEATETQKQEDFASSHRHSFEYFGVVPHALVPDNLVEIYHDTQRVACHKVSKREYGYTTQIDHMPKAHQYVHGWSTGYFLDEAGKVGQSTCRAIEILLKRSEHVEQGYRAARGILQLAQTYSASRLEKACERALLFKNVYCSTIKSILKQGIDKKAVIIKQEPSYKNIVAHENIRGAVQYQ